jgi:hypothetical protein
MAESGAIRIVDVVDRSTFRVPPCADGRFDHRSCDYWEDEVRGSKAARPAWWQAQAPGPPTTASRPSLADNPFAPPARDIADNPFASTGTGGLLDPFGPDPDDDDDDGPAENPFAPSRPAAAPADTATPRKLGQLLRGTGLFGSYAKVLEWQGEPAVYAQFGPLTAYPRAQRIRDLYPRLPQMPLPAVITCIATAAIARDRRLAQRLVAEVCDDLAGRGFSAVEAYPDLTLDADEASAATPGFWVTCGFAAAADDERFPVMRRELA